jgi:Fur family peroxide stress response transcriptional regulator
MVISHKSDSAVIEALRSRGYKATPQRIAVCRIALSSRDHPSAQQVYAEVKEIHPTVSLATVYKTLQILRDLGLVQELNFPKGQARFDSYMKPHVNLICIKCGDISDLDNLITEEIIKKVASAARFKPCGQRVDVYGICQKCFATEH